MASIAVCCLSFVGLGTVYALSPDSLSGLADSLWASTNNVTAIVSTKDGRRVPAIIGSNNLISEFSSPLNATLTFDITKRRRVPHLSIDGVTISVKSFTPLAEVKPSGIAEYHYAAGYQSQGIPIYRVVIDKPPDDDSPSSQSALGFTRDVLGMGRPRQINVVDDLPIMIGVVINAKTSGLYSFSVQVQTHYRDKKDAVEVLERPLEWLFVSDDDAHLVPGYRPPQSKVPTVTSGPYPTRPPDEFPKGAYGPPPPAKDE